MVVCSGARNVTVEYRRYTLSCRQLPRWSGCWSLRESIHSLRKVAKRRRHNRWQSKMSPHRRPRRGALGQRCKGLTALYCPKTFPCMKARQINLATCKERQRDCLGRTGLLKTTPSPELSARYHHSNGGGVRWEVEQPQSKRGNVSAIGP